MNLELWQVSCKPPSQNYTMLMNKFRTKDITDETHRLALTWVFITEIIKNTILLSPVI